MPEATFREHVRFFTVEGLDPFENLRTFMSTLPENIHMKTNMQNSGPRIRTCVPWAWRVTEIKRLVKTRQYVGGVRIQA